MPLLDLRSLLEVSSENITGIGALTFDWSEAATGDETLIGTGAVSFTFSEAATGAETFTGSGAVVFGFALAASGDVVSDVTGTGGVAFGFSIAANGTGGVVSVEGGPSVGRRLIRLAPVQPEVALPEVHIATGGVAFGFAVSGQGYINDDDLAILLAA